MYTHKKHAYNRSVVYIYTVLERKRCVYVYIHTLLEKERERERERERGRERQSESYVYVPGPRLARKGRALTQSQKLNEEWPEAPQLFSIQAHLPGWYPVIA